MRFSFDEYYIGITETGISINIKIVKRPLDITLNHWYKIAANVISVLNRVEDNPFYSDKDSVAAKSVASCPHCGGDSFYDYSAELYKDIDGALLYCDKCGKQWVYKYDQ